MAAVEGLLFVGDGEVFEVLGWQRVLVAEDDCLSRLVVFQSRKEGNEVVKLEDSFEALTFIDLCNELARSTFCRINHDQTYSIPFANPIAESLESNACIFDKVGYDFLAQPPSISILQHQWGVPMI